MYLERTPVSAHCTADRHTFCTLGMAMCGCTECHFVCTRCFRECRRLYGESLCPTCYGLELKATPQTRCEHPGCTSTRAYRDLRVSDDHLCIRHHRELGHQINRPV